MVQLSIVFLLTFSLGCGVIGAPTVTLGKGKIGWVHFPGAFTRKDSGPGAKIISTLDYEVRKLAGSSNELIVGMSDYHDERGELNISDDFYIVTLDGKFKSRRATSADWKNAAVLPLARQREVAAHHPYPVVGDGQGGVSYNGKNYPRAVGCSWSQTQSFLSPGKKYLAVLSDDSEDRHWPGIPGLSGGGRTKGHLFVDVYDTNSGEKLLAAKAHHNGGAGPSFDESIWINDNYFILPLDPIGGGRSGVGEDCLLAILP
jgi:hypothetical protein